MGLFRLLKLSKKEPPIRESEKPFYQPDSYYKDASYKGTEFEKKVIPFDERKKISYPSKRGLYVAEILLLKYCSYGTYPKPKTGYPGFWWYEYGIRNVGAKLESLEQRGFIKMNQASNKYELTDLGSAELFDNGYVPYMHKSELKTIENSPYGPEFNVWSINRLVGQGSLEKWPEYVAAGEEKVRIWLNRPKIYETTTPKNKEEADLMAHLKSQDDQIAEIQKAEKHFEDTGDIGALLEFWENLWANGGLKFNGSHWTFRLADLYIKIQQYDDALQAVKMIKNPAYKEKKAGYIEKIEKLSSKKKRENSKNCKTV